MTVDFRCENCGKLLNVDANPGSAVRCPHCHKKVTVPEALAALPRPLVPGNNRPQAPQPAPGAPQGQEQPQQEDEHVEGQAVMGAMATIMPWVISLFMHLGLFLIMLFFVMMVNTDKIPETVVVPDAVLSDTPGGVIDPLTATPSHAQNEKRTVVKRYTKREDQVDSGKTEKTVALLAPSADGAKGGADVLGLTNSDSRGGPRSNFFGSGGNAYHIVYIVDRSGSMAPTFDEVRVEMLKSIARLQPIQNFSIILFANNQCIEGPRKSLVSADIDNKLTAAAFLKQVTASGQTTVLPALQRAFALLKFIDPKRPGKLIYLLSDGDFAGVTGGSTYTPEGGGAPLQGNQAVVQWLRDNNKEKGIARIYVNTYLYLGREKSAIDVMKQIAQENGGRFKHISADE